MRPVAIVARLVSKWKQRAGAAANSGTGHWLNHSAIATTLALLAALQALELAGACVATSAGEKVRGGPTPQPPPPPLPSTAALGSEGQTPKPPRDVAVAQTYLRPHATHLALVVYHPLHRPVEPAYLSDRGGGGRGGVGGGSGGFGGGGGSGSGSGSEPNDAPKVTPKVAAIKHFNLSNWEVGVALLELLGSHAAGHHPAPPPSTDHPVPGRKSPGQHLASGQSPASGEDPRPAEVGHEGVEATSGAGYPRAAAPQQGWKPARWTDTFK
jgi:hypothetical protein